MAVLIEAEEMCNLGIENLKTEVEQIAHKIKEVPQFVIINASNNLGNTRYIDNKVKECHRVGIKPLVLNYEEDCNTQDIIDNIEYCKKNKIPVIFQMPSFPHLNTDEIFKAISPEIDADGFTKEWLGEVTMGNDMIVAPATPKGVIKLLEHFHVCIEGKNALVIGRSNHVGKPMGIMLTNRGATVTIAHSKTGNLKDLIRQADILISCVGKPKLIAPEDVKENAVLIGVGFSYINGKQILDFDTEDMIENSKASLVTNRVRCTGTATVHALIDNVVELHKKNHK